MRIFGVLGAAGLIAVAPAGAAHDGSAVETFVVNSASGAADAGINGDCDTDATADDDCTLASAIAEANAHDEGAAGARDAITFSTTDAPGDPDDVAFVRDTSQASATINGPLPPITDGVNIATGNCAQLPALEAAPCAAINTPVAVDSTGEVRISGFAFSGTTVAIHVAEVSGETVAIPDFALENTWFGVEKTGVKGSAVPPGTAVLLEDVVGAEIGGTTPQQRNLFARQVTGIDVFGADDTVILGNEFGVLADGSFAREGEGGSSNADNIEVTGDDNGSGQTADDDPAVGTEIGRAAPADAATPSCDGACNLITRAGISASVAPQFRAGIDLAAESAENELPAERTTIRGNEIGGGAVTGGRNEIGINVGASEDTLVGGEVAGAANVIARNQILSSSGVTGLAVVGNLIGFRGDGNSLAAEAPMLNLDGSGSVTGNRIAAPSSGPGVRLRGSAAPGFTVQGNTFGERANGSSAPIGLEAILIQGDAHTIGGPGAGEGNLFSTSSAGTGIRVTGDGNEILGNRFGLGTAGEPRPLDTAVALAVDADDNIIGGDSAAAENVISNSVLDAISVQGADSDGNVVARNRGAGNEGLFIDLGADGAGNAAEPVGPNGGAQAPAITSAGQATVAGTAAPGANVRVFAQTTGAAGEIDEFLGQATADGGGVWQATIATQAVGRPLVATATTATGTSELSATATVAGPPPPDGGDIGDGGLGGSGDADGGDGGDGADVDPPETRIDKRPKNTISKPNAKYRFSSDEPGSKFRCRLDRNQFKPCRSPRALRKLDEGKHRFQVVAVDAAGNADPSAAKDRFRVE